MVQIRVQPRADGVSGWFATTAGCQTNIGARREGEREFDFVIIGLSLVHRLIENSHRQKLLSLMLLQVGEATSGRKAGFIIDVLHHVDGGKLFQLSNFAINLLNKFKDRYAICFDWQDAGKIYNGT